jgi:ABC-type Fe3+/spermidine/putrescine transport system ATPase subunit
MNAGVVEQIGPPQEIYGAPRSPFVADFVGLSNFLPGRLRATAGDISQVEVVGRLVLARARPELAEGQEVLVFVRPNEIELHPVGQAPAQSADDPPSNTFTATVEQVTYLGDRMDYRVRLGSAASLRVQSETRFAEGTAVIARFSPAHARVMPPRR